MQLTVQYLSDVQYERIHTYICQRNQTYSVVSAPTVTSSVIMNADIRIIFGTVCVILYVLIRS